MLTLDKHINLSSVTIDGQKMDVCKAPNLTSLFAEEDLRRIGEFCWSGYDQDERSRAPWLRRMQAAMKLALQIQEEKTFPWANCSNIAFPLITIATLQFHSRAYPALFPGPDIVKYRVSGPDPKGELTQTALAVSRYMSYQVLEEDESFEEQHDRLLINLPIVGCAFIKTTHRGSLRRNSSELVLAQDLVIDYYAKSVDSAQRKTQKTPLYRNEIHERCVAGMFKDVREDSWYSVPFSPQQTQEQVTQDQISGKVPPTADASTPVMFLEQHCWLDLDGDGYSEPYVVTFEPENRMVVRIVARWEFPESVERVRGEVLRIKATEYYTKFELIPAADNSIYGAGFGVLLGPLNESVNTMVNQLIDAGTMSVAAGGFLSRGVKLRGGAFTFQPFGWQRVESTGDDLRKGIFPLPVREPSNVLFQLLTLIINYTQRISGSTDVMSGENPGQNTPANNMNVMVEQGQKIYSACYKRCWRSLRDEFRKLYLLNSMYLPDEVPFGDGIVTRAMFLGDPSKVAPVADPAMVSESAKVQQAMTIKQAAMTTPGYNLPEVEKRLLAALHVDGVEVLYPGPDKVPPLPNAKAMVEQQKTQREQMKLEQQKQEFIISMMEEQRINNAKIMELEAKAAKFMAEADGVEAGHKIAAFEAAIGAMKNHSDNLNKQVEMMLKSMESKDGQSGSVGGHAGGMGSTPGNESVPSLGAA